MQHKIAVIGAGYVGLISGLCFADLGFSVTFIDSDIQKINSLKSGKSHIYEEGIEPLLKNNQNKVSFCNDYSALKDCSIIILAVGTPQDLQGKCDMRFFYRAIDEIIATKSTLPRSMIIKSTVPIGTASALANKLKNKGISDLHIISNPEFLQEGTAIHNFMNPDRIILGCATSHAKKTAKEIYASFQDRDIKILYTDNTTAEIIKYASNSYLAMRVAFINEIADLSESFDGNISDISYGMGLDNRIGLDYLRPSPGYGGSCFPKDTNALHHIAKSKNLELSLVASTIKSNSKRISKIAKKIFDATNNQNTKIAVLGLAFKGNTDDVRDSPSIKIIKELSKYYNISITAYDPKAMDAAKTEITQINSVTLHADQYSACDKVDMIIIGTPWAQFKALDFNKLSKTVKNIEACKIFDLHNILDPDLANKYKFTHIRTGFALQDYSK